ncbi:hypothetical protein [Albibacterium sp.]|uniref:hypothetical protein n=1 Tax=Albibacterium sp. TaxID=2952885 RepID=UPI002CE3A2D1|nr:hypothetical protein [Albibacterium sp.]HUH17758.1 hypothetical protein [Albibacterium sp.]
MTILKFLLLFSAFAVIVIILPYGVENYFSVSLLSKQFLLIGFFLFFLTIIVYIVSYLGIEKGGQNSVLSVLGGLTVKMIFSLAMILLLFLKTAENQKVLAGNFFYVYFLFTLFEVICLLRNLRDQNKM